jgi:hypothetical protein
MLKNAKKWQKKITKSFHLAIKMIVYFLSIRCRVGHLFRFAAAADELKLMSNVVKP